MKITLHLDKSIEENASIYYDEAKKYKKKIEGAIQAAEKARTKLKNIEKKKPEDRKFKQKSDIKKEWYEKFRWFMSSEGFIIICGKDATSNEIIIKKHTDPTDVVFHTAMPGSPFCVIKTEGKTPGEATLNETAQETASYSRAWKLGILTLETFYVTPEQVSKTPMSGEYMAKGSFMIYGKKNIITPKMELSIGITKDNKIIAGPTDAIKVHAVKFVTIIQGKEKTGEISKKIFRKIGGDLDEIARFLPTGGCDFKKSS